MELDLMTPGLGLRQAQDLARQAEVAGFSGMVVTEAGRTAYLTCAAAALAAPSLHLLTGVAVAFPRSPMVTAQVAWELADASAGRFRLGLGTQVRAHIERRYSAPFDPPGPRLRDYVQAVRAAFRAFRGDGLAHDGDHYSLSLLPAQWSPGAIGVDDPPIDVAAVNPWMLRMAGEVADGVHVHPLNTPTYLATTVLPELAAGAARVGRDPWQIERICPAFAAPGETADEIHRRWEHARIQVAFYGSTPNYAFVFEQLGREGTTQRIRERQKAGDIPGMAAVIDDEILGHFCVRGSWAEVADGLIERYAGIATRVVSYFAGMEWLADPSSLGPWGELARDVRSRASSPGSGASAGSDASAGPDASAGSDA